MTATPPRHSAICAASSLSAPPARARLRSPAISPAPWALSHVEFDSYRHGPNWTETPDDEFVRQLAHALSGDRWVADGNYSMARDSVWPRATAIVWLDFNFGLVFWRLALRTLRRGITRETLWNGNKENLFSHLFTRHSLFLWAFKSHWRRRRTLSQALAQPQHTHLRLVRLRSPRAAARWLADVQRASTVPSHSEG